MATDMATETVEQAVRALQEALDRRDNGGESTGKRS